MSPSPTINVATPVPLPQPTTADSPPSPSPPAPPQQNTAATLRPLYTRAVRAFLHRDIVLTHSLLTSAFALITPPLTTTPDSLADHRRKWDVLRITLDVTVYTAPPADSASIPAPLRSNALLSAAALLATLHTRSIRLFAPADGPAPNPSFLPAQVLVTLALSSAKIGCPAAGRGIIEEWLACRAPATASEDGYEKVLEVYILSILPALGEWAYARQFLGYENELPARSREHLTASLASLHEQHLVSLNRLSPQPVSPAAPSSPATPKSTPALSSFIHRSSSSSTTGSQIESPSSITPTPSRPSSPTPSDASTSTNSTHTAVPANPHPRASKSKLGQANGNGHAPLAPLTPTPSSSTATSTSHRAPLRPLSLGAQPHNNSSDDDHSPTRRSATPPFASASTEGSRPISWHILTSTSPSSSSLIESMHAALRPYIRYAPLFLFCVVLPALAMLLRLLRRRRPRAIISPSSAATAAAAAMVAGAGLGVGSGAGRSEGVLVGAARMRAVEEVRRRLSGVQGRRGLLGAMWDEAIRAIWDTVAMGGRGLV